MPFYGVNGGSFDPLNQLIIDYFERVAQFELTFKKIWKGDYQIGSAFDLLIFGYKKSRIVRLLFLHRTVEIQERQFPTFCWKWE